MSALPPVLTPPATRPHLAVTSLPKAWYVACTSTELRDKPLARTVLGIPLVVFRSAAGAAALLDRCPHRNVPLSEGKVVNSELECAYHGWRFDGQGACVSVPGLLDTPAGAPARCAVRYPCEEQDGLVWVWCDPDTAPTSKPYVIPGVSDKRYTIARLEMDLPSTLLSALENLLDVPHTAFLHAGLFRSAKVRNRITAKIRRTADGVECQYIGEPRPTGLIGRVLAPGGGIVEHYDRFMMPCIGQVEYKMGESSHIIATQVMTPITDFLTRTYAVLAFRMPIPGAVVRPILEPVIRRILKQDAWVLQKITDNVTRFGGERFTHTDIDLVGPDIWYLLRRAERGELDREAAFSEREVSLEV